MSVEVFKARLNSEPNIIEFTETIAAVDSKYRFTPTAFSNGKLINEAGQNSGSCKVFAFALKEGLTKKETLACFGQYYFNDVLQDPNGSGHQNIRNFMKTGFQGLSFQSEPLK